jgi:hypothetical protein
MALWTSEHLTARAAACAREDTDEAPMTRFPFRLAARLAMTLVGALGDREVTPDEGDAIERAYDAFSEAFKEWRQGRKG